MVTACSAPDAHVADATDCDDAEGTIHPDADEVCDGIDNDCDGTIDEDDASDATVWYADLDADGHPGDVSTTIACAAPLGHGADATDCDDHDYDIHPDADEVCDGIDNDCDGTTDEDDATDASTWYADSDSDGYGDSASATEGCSAPDGYVADATDCDDAESTIHPGAPETCDGTDNDCDEAVDEDLMGTGSECAATSCSTILDERPDASSGSYYVDGGTDTVVLLSCQMDIDGGGWTQLTSDYLALLSDGPSWTYLYTYGTGWYRTPPSTLLWDWSAYQPLDGTYTYGMDGSTSATGTFSCTHGEAGHWGVGCSNCGGGCWKAFPIYNKDPTPGTSTICQDQPDAFHVGACAHDVQIWVR